MKKYVKPEIYIERFDMSQQIAACDYDSNNTANDINCNFTGLNKDWGMTMTIFVAEENGCTFQVEDYCYHGSASGHYNIFNS